MPKKHKDIHPDVILTDNKLKSKLDKLTQDITPALEAEIIDKVSPIPFTDSYKTGKLDDSPQPSQNTHLDHHALDQSVSHLGVGDWNDEDKGSPLEKRGSLPQILQDLEVPTKKTGPWSSSIDKERWRNVCEVLLSRNVKNAYQISKLTGLSNHQALRFVKEIQESWQSDLTPQRVNLRREKLYSENDRISDFCWQMIAADPTAREVPQYLKIIGDSNTRRARLIGAENIVLQTTETKKIELDSNELTLQTAQKLGISVDTLKLLGDSLSDNMNEDN